MRQKFQRNIILGLLVLTGIGSALLILELGARLFIPPPSLNDSQFENYGEVYVCSSMLGWRGRPHYEGLMERTEFTTPLRFNSRGMHDTEHAFTKPDNTFRILFTGDSFVEAVQLEEAYTAHQQLENLLNKQLAHTGLNFEVIVGGITGWGTGQELAYYRTEGHRYQPDLVLLMFFMGNDVRNNLPGHALTIDGFNCFAPYFPVCANGELDPQPWAYIPGLEAAWGSCGAAQRTIVNTFDMVQNNAYLLARLEPLILAAKPIRRYGQQYPLPFTALYLTQETPEVRYGWQVTERILQQYRDEAAAHGSEFAVSIIGPQEVIWLSTLSPEKVYEGNPYLRNAQMDYPNRRLGQFLQAENIPMLDLQPPMLEYIEQTGAALYLPIDRHWTQEGNRVAAEFLLGWLVEQGLVPTE